MDEGWVVRKELLKENVTVTRPLARIGVECLPSRRKSSAKKRTPRALREGINKYFGWCEKEDELPSISGMMVHMGMFQGEFYRLVKREDLRDLMEQARLIIRTWAETDVYNTKGMAAGKIAYMKNTHGWADRLETKNETHVTQISVEAARERIEALAPKLLEVLRSSTVVSQLSYKDAQEGEIIK